MTRVCVKERNNLSLCAPAIDIVLDELNVENGSRQIPFEHEGADTEGRLHFSQLHWDVDIKRFLGNRHVKVPFESRYWYYSLKDANRLAWCGSAPSRSLHAPDRFFGRPHGMGEKSKVDHRRLVTVAPNWMPRAGGRVLDNGYL